MKDFEKMIGGIVSGGTMARRRICYTIVFVGCSKREKKFWSCHYTKHTELRVVWWRRQQRDTYRPDGAWQR